MNPCTSCGKPSVIKYRPTPVPLSGGPGLPPPGELHMCERCFKAAVKERRQALKLRKPSDCCNACTRDQYLRIEADRRREWERPVDRMAVHRAFGVGEVAA